MAIIKKIKINKVLEKKIYSDLLKEFKKVNSFESVDQFFGKFMTQNEKTVFIRRFAVMKLLNQGRKYKDIKNTLNISRVTISNIQDILAGRGYGKNPNRKRKYSERRTQSESKRFKRKYKGAINIIDLI